MKHGFAGLLVLGVISGLLAAQSGSGLEGYGVTLSKPAGLQPRAYGTWDPGWARSVAGQRPRWDPPLFTNARSGLFYPDSYLQIWDEEYALPIWIFVAPTPPAAVAIPDAPPKPPAPPRSETREYTWPHSRDNTPTPTLSLVLKDGSIRPALAMCIQDSKLSYVTPQGTGEEIPLELFDPEATRKVNTPGKST